jgi:hypothetical protein
MKTDLSHADSEENQPNNGLASTDTSQQSSLLYTFSGATDAIQIITALTKRSISYAADPIEAAKDIVGVTSHLLQSALRGTFLQDVIEDLDKLKNEGDLLEGRLADVAVDSITELLEFIDSTTTRDSERFRAVRAIFVQGMRISSSEQDRMLSREFLLLAKKLEGADFVVLRACYELHKTGEKTTSEISAWSSAVAEKCGYGIRSMVLARESNLVTAYLWGKRIHSDESGISESHRARLTDLGLKFCEFLEKGGAALSVGTKHEPNSSNPL